MVKKPAKRKPRTTNKAILDKNAQISKDLSTSTSLSEQIEADAPTAPSPELASEQTTAQAQTKTEKPEDSPVKKTKDKIILAHTCPDERCSFKTTSDEKNCPYDGNKLVLDKKLNH